MLRKGRNILLNDAKHIIARRAAQELCDGQVVNLGIGIPTLITEYLDDKTVYLQTENGLLGMGPPPTEDLLDIDLINAGKEPITILPGASFFNSADSFGMIRGGHVDVAVLGVLQVDQYGEIANWAVPNQPILGVGGAMDLLTGANKVIAVGTLFAKDGTPKLVPSLSYKSSGSRKVEMFITEHAVFKFNEQGVEIVEILSDMTYEQLNNLLNINLGLVKS